MAKRSTLQDRLKLMRSEIERSKEYRREREEDWKRYVDLYRGKHVAKGMGIQDRVIVNIIFATKNVIAPSVAINNPKFIVNPLDEDSQDQALLTEEILNSIWRQHKYQDEIRLAVDDWILTGHGWVKCLFKDKADEPKIVTEVEYDPSPNTREDYPESAVVGVDDRDPAVEGQTESEATDIWSDRPYPERVSPFDMFVDPDARSMRDLRWIAQRIWRPRADVQADERYDRKARMEVGTADRYGTGSGQEGNENPNSGPNDYVEVIEFYDIKRNEMATFAMGGTSRDEQAIGAYLIKPQTVVAADPHPFKMLRNYEVPDQFYPMGEVEQIEPQQLELNEVRTQMLNHRKRFARKYAYMEDYFDERGTAALQSDVDGTIVPIKDGVPGGAAGAVAALPAIPTPPEIYSQNDVIQDDINKISGVNDYMRGMPDTRIRRTATEAAMIQDSANARSSDKLVKVESFLCEVAEGIVKLMQQFMTGQAVARIVGVAGTAWINYDRDYLQGSFSYEIEGGSTQPRNESFRRQSAMQLMDIAFPFIQMGVLNPQAVARYVLQHGFGIKDFGTFMQAQGGMPVEDPTMQQAQGQMPPGQGMPPGGDPMAQLTQMLGQMGGAPTDVAPSGMG